MPDHSSLTDINFAFLNVVSDVILIRTWVLMNSKGIYQSQISIPKLALVQPSFEDGRYLCLDAPGMPTLKLDIHMEEEDTRERVMLKYVIGEMINIIDYQDHQ
jgi:hypothetical protein